MHFLCIKYTVKYINVLIYVDGPDKDHNKCQKYKNCVWPDHVCLQSWEYVLCGKCILCISFQAMIWVVIDHAMTLNRPGICSNIFCNCIFHSKDFRNDIYFPTFSWTVFLFFLLRKNELRVSFSIIVNTSKNTSDRNRNWFHIMPLHKRAFHILIFIYVVCKI